MPRLTRFALAALALAALPVRAEHGLEELEGLLNQPVYAASKFAQAAAEAPAAVTVLTAGDIRTYGWRTLGEVLGAVRGVHLRNDRVYDYLGVRGISRPGDYSSRVLLLIDGVRNNDNVFDSVLIGREFPLDVSLIDRIEFIAGPGSALYGSNAVLGVVNVVTRRGQAAGGEIALAAGSAASRKAVATFGREVGGASLLLSASAENRPGRDLFFPALADPPASDGIARNLDVERDRKLYARLSAGEWSAFGLASERTKRAPTGYYGTSLTDPRNELLDRLLQIGVQWQRTLAGGDALSVQSAWSRYDFNGNYAYPDGSADRTSAHGRWWAGEARYTTRRFAGQHLVAGFEWQRNVEQDKGYALTHPAYEPIARTRVDSHRLGAYVNDEIALGRDWRLTLGARADRQVSGDWTVTPRLAAVWQAAPRLYLKALAGSAYREPNSSEAYYEDDVNLPNPDLRRERIKTRELALDWRVRDDWRLAASAYDNHVGGVIELLDLGNGFFQYRNLGTLRVHGLELESDAVLPHGWRARTSVALQDVRDGTGARASNAPGWLGKLHVSAPLGDMPARLGLEWQGTGERRTLSGARLGSQGVINLTLRVEPASSRWSAALSVYDLMDRKLVDPAGSEHAFDTLTRDGRSVEVRLALRF